IGNTNDTQEVVKEGGQTGGQTRECVYELIKTNPYITRDELSKVLGISPSAIQKHIDKLKEVRIRRIGGDFGGHWEIIS
ncbi:MAG: winged helix-turn-helix transcriptional regulator, partial [Paludibacteraceae bacterium]|nr:winged helix-turn-helix transcriptional regulator [Paludibacteraceae bacterium]